jgi:hypothetical protein
MRGVGDSDPCAVAGFNPLESRAIRGLLAFMLR